MCELTEIETKKLDEIIENMYKKEWFNYEQALNDIENEYGETFRVHIKTELENKYIKISNNINIGLQGYSEGQTSRKLTEEGKRRAKNILNERLK